MNDFNWSEFSMKIAVNADIKILYNAWTVSSEIKKWFLKACIFTDLDGNAVNENISVNNGFMYQWNWFLFEDSESGTYTKANGSDAIQFTFAGHCTVDVSFSQQNGFVLVNLTQKNIPLDDISKQNIRLGCQKGWSFFLLNLKSVYEGGIDLRNKNEQLKGMLNN